MTDLNTRTECVKIDMYPTNCDLYTTGSVPFKISGKFKFNHLLGDQTQRFRNRIKT